MIVRDFSHTLLQCHRSLNMRPLVIQLLFHLSHTSINTNMPPQHKLLGTFTSFPVIERVLKINTQQRLSHSSKTSCVLIPLHAYFPIQVTQYKCCDALVGGVPYFYFCCRLSIIEYVGPSNLERRIWTTSGVFR